jgi:hypothetical protein
VEHVHQMLWKTTSSGRCRCNYNCCSFLLALLWWWLIAIVDGVKCSKFSCCVGVIGIGRNQQKNSRIISMGTIKFASTSWISLMKLTCNNFVALLVLLIILTSSNNNNISALIVTIGITTPPPLVVFHFFLLLLLLQFHLLTKLQLDFVKPLLYLHTIFTLHLFKRC